MDSLPFQERLWFHFEQSFFFPSENGSTLKGNILIQFGAKFFPSFCELVYPKRKDFDSIWSKVFLSFCKWVYSKRKDFDSIGAKFILSFWKWFYSTRHWFHLEQSFFFPSENGSTLKEKTLIPFGAKFTLSFWKWNYSKRKDFDSTGSKVYSFLLKVDLL